MDELLSMDDEAETGVLSESADGVVVPLSDDAAEELVSWDTVGIVVLLENDGETELVSEDGRVVLSDESLDDLESGEGVEELPSGAAVDKDDPEESVLESPAEVADVVELTSVDNGVEPAAFATVVQFVTELESVVKSKLLSFLCWPAPEEELVNRF